MARRATMLAVDGQAEKFRWPADWTPIHPEANRYPMMNDDKARATRASIAKLGLLDPIVLDKDGRIVDGRNRERFGRELGVERRYVTTDQNVKDIVHAGNTARRHSTASQEVAQILLGYTK